MARIGGVDVPRNKKIGISIRYVFGIGPSNGINILTKANVNPETRTLSDKWTVITLDGLPSAHAEHTLAVTLDGPEVLTLTKEQKRLRQAKSADNGALAT